MSRPNPRDTQPSRRVDDPFQDPSPLPRARRHRWLLWLLVLLLLGSFALVTGLVVYQPGALGLARIPDLRASDEAAAARIRQTEQALDATAAALTDRDQASLDRDRALQGTLAALANRENLLGQTLTQQALNDSATRTAVVVINAQQATQAAQAVAATQAALVQTATAVQRDFEATQTALLSQLPTAVPPPPASLLTLDAGFVTGGEANRWDAVPLVEGWALTDANALLARLPGATLLTAWGDFGENYGLLADMTPPADTTTPTDYVVLFGLDQTGHALYITVERGAVTQVAIYEVGAQSVMAAQPDGLTPQPERLRALVRGLAIPADRVAVRLDITGGTVRVTINDQPLTDADLALPVMRVVGAVGVRLPVGAQVLRLRVLPR